MAKPAAKRRNALAESAFSEGGKKMDRDARGRFVTGHSKGGRPLGSHNKFGTAFVADLYADWRVHGPEVIKKVRDKTPAAYLRIVGSLMPKQLEIKDDAFEGLTDEQLAGIIAYVNNALGVAQDDEDGTSQATH
jgi:hypothetical protein